MKSLKIDKLSSNRFDESELSKISGGYSLCRCVNICDCDYIDEYGTNSMENLNAIGGRTSMQTSNDHYAAV